VDKQVNNSGNCRVLLTIKFCAHAAHFFIIHE